MMEQYLMMLYVTLEQETALKKFFIDQGWAYCKPDLSVTTDKLGSARITTTPDTGDDSETATSVTGKRKARAISKGAPKVKYVKVLTSPMVSQSGTGNVHQNSIEIQNKDVSESENQLHIPANEQLLFYDNTQNEGDDIENTDYVVKTERTIGDIVDEYIEEAEIEDVGDDENDDTDMDDNMEVIEGDTENVLDEPEFGTKFNPGKKSHAEDKGHGKKETLQQVVEGEKIDGTECTDNKEDVIEQLLSQSHCQNTYKCCICEKEIRIKYNMKRHLRTHLPGQINCVMCNRFFDSIEDKEEHMSKRHASPHVCETCGLIFKRKSDLNAHVVKHDTEEESATCFKCTYKNCGKVFFRQANYEYHLNKHNGEKPYKCMNCVKTFHSKYVKNEHEKNCFLNVQFKCDECDSMFKHRSGLHNHKQAEHIRSEKGYTCELCSNTFKFSTSLIRHKKDKHQCLDASQQTETSEAASEFQVQATLVPTRESEVYAPNVESTQSSNATVVVVADSALEGLISTPAVEVEDTQASRNSDMHQAEVLAGMTNPLLEGSADINIERVIVLHQVASGLPDHLQGMSN